MSSALDWLKGLGAAGVIASLGRGMERLWRAGVERPLRKAERDAEYWRGKYLECAGELKANTGALERVKRATQIAAGAPPESLPPPRAELPTLTCFVEGPGLRAWAEEEERTRAAPLNPSRHARRPPPLEGVRVVETYSIGARPTRPAPAGTPERPAAMAPLFPPPRGAPRPPRPR